MINSEHFKETRRIKKNGRRLPSSETHNIIYFKMEDRNLTRKMDIKDRLIEYKFRFEIVTMFQDIQ